MSVPDIHQLLLAEVGGMLERLGLTRRLALGFPMPMAAALTPRAASLIDGLIETERSRCAGAARALQTWLQGRGRVMPVHLKQQRLAATRMRFQDWLEQLDIFSDVVSQRGEADVGVWASGLEVLAEESLELPPHIPPPPIICSIEKGIGAAIRRAATRLPGGSPNPVAVIHVPRERLACSAVGGSLIHEVGHQWSALLGLREKAVSALQANLFGASQAESTLWSLWSSWISEILSDLWSVAHLGAAAVIGMQSVMTLPNHYIFALKPGDPHPIPWVRVILQSVMGEHLHPDPQWARLRFIWKSRYPLSGAPPTMRCLLERLENHAANFSRALLAAPTGLAGQTLGDLCRKPDRSPAALRALGADGRGDYLSGIPSKTRALAVLGQMVFEQQIDPASERKLLTNLVFDWAQKRALGTSTHSSTTQPIHPN